MFIISVVLTGDLFLCQFPDEEHGEWFGYLSQQGKVVLDFKGGPFKGECCFIKVEELFPAFTVHALTEPQVFLTLLVWFVIQLGNLMPFLLMFWK